MTATSQRLVLGDATLAELRSSLRGELIGPTDPAYHRARAVWNGDIDRYPAMIVRCAGVADVITAVQFARSHDLLVAIRGGGHSFAGFGTCEGGMVIDLSPMEGLRVDPQTRTVRAQAGLTWAEFDHETQAFGLATTGGLVSSTGISGFTLGGGLGWLARSRGMAVDNLLGADLVTADGEAIRVDAQSHPELFWALRGGGGNFGVVTSLEYQLHEIGPVVVGGGVFHRAAAAPDLLKFYREWVSTVPNELTTLVVGLTAPPLPFIPADLVGTPMIAVMVCCIGELDSALDAIAELRRYGQPVADTINPIRYLALQSLSDATAPFGLPGYFRNLYLDDISDEVIEIFSNACTRLGELQALSALHIQHLGGAIDAADPHSTAYGGRGHTFLANIIAVWDQPTQRDRHVQWAQWVDEALTRQTATTARYVNFLTDPAHDTIHDAYGKHRYARLRTIKRQYDPHNFFRVNLNIPPQAD